MTRTLIASMAAAAVLSIALLAPIAGRAQQDRVVRSSISGHALSLRLATAGQPVREGEPLLFLRTATGSAQLAAIAPFDGTVVRVFVRANAFVNLGDPVAEVVQP